MEWFDCQNWIIAPKRIKNIRIIQIINMNEQKMNKKVIMLVDNRAAQDPFCDPSKNSFRGSAFKATEIDPHEGLEMRMTAFDETLFLSSLHDRIAALERRIDSLDDGGKGERIKRRFRRKAKEISREFKCTHQGCQRYYGSETSLKNHLKLKHGKSSEVTQN